MSGHIELALLSRVIQDGDFHSLTKAQIDESYFYLPESKEIFKYLKEVFHDPQTPGLVPSFDMVRMEFQSFHPVIAPDPVPLLAQKLRKERVRIELLNLAENLKIMAEQDPMVAMAELKGEATKISSLAEVGEDLSMAGSYDYLLSQYEMVQNTQGLLGIPYPWDALNEETQGMQDGQFIVMYGRPKSMKTWVACYMGVHAYLHSRRRVLIYTREMSPKLMAMRVAALLAGVDYKHFKNGNLQPAMKAKLFTILKELADDEKSAGAAGHNQPYIIITTDRSAKSGGGGGGVMWLQAKIRDLKPDLVIVDGMYLMKDDRSGQRTVDWKAIAHISQDLKLTAQSFEIPLIGITQANRQADKAKGEDLTELAFSDSLGQDADAVFRISKEEVFDEALQRNRTELYINAPGLREGVFEGIVINGQPATSFDFLRKIVPASAKETEQYGKQKGVVSPPGGGSFKKGQQSFMDPKINFGKR